MRIFYGFLVIMVSVGLFLLPVTDAAYDFRTDVKEDVFRVDVPAAFTTANVTLVKELYNDDISTVSITSDDNDDTPVPVTYHTATRLLDIDGLIEPDGGNHTLTVSYDVDALGATSALSAVVDKVSWIWLICLVCFPIAAIVYILFGVKK